MTWAPRRPYYPSEIRNIFFPAVSIVRCHRLRHMRALINSSVIYNLVYFFFQYSPLTTTISEHHELGLPRADGMEHESATFAAASVMLP